MSDRFWRLRWWLARLIAPARIMADPYPDLDHGAFVVARYASGVRVTFKAESLRVKMNTKLPSLHEYDDMPTFTPARTTGKFVGTICS